MKYYSVLKRNELSNHEKTWRNLKSILLTERSQSEKTTLLYDSNYMTFWKRQNNGDSKKISGASLVVQWLRVCLPMQGTRVRALVWEDPTCRGATRPVSHNY